MSAGESAAPAPVTAGGRASAETSSIAARAAFDQIRYASVWEDADVLCEALGARAAGGRLLSIASAGDNALALLTLDPAEVVAVDLSPAQIACLELRIAAFRRLDDQALPAFLGVTPASDRLAVHRRLAADLTPESAAFWEAHREAIAGGVIHAGRFERYLRAFRRWVLPLVHSRRTIERLCRLESLEEQRDFYARHWDTWRWRVMFRLFFSRFVMGRLGRDPEFFAHVGGAVGERLLVRSRHALTELPLATNPYFVYIMTGNFTEAALPRYLRPVHREAIRARLDRVRPVRGDIARLDGSFDGFNLSDIFEYMSPAEHERVYTSLVERATPGARLVYWNMLAPRGLPASLAKRVLPIEALAATLHARDRAWFYRALHVDEVMAAPGAMNG